MVEVKSCGCLETELEIEAVAVAVAVSMLCRGCVEVVVEAVIGVEAVVEAVLRLC